MKAPENKKDDETPEPPLTSLYLELPLSMAERYDRKRRPLTYKDEVPGDDASAPKPFWRFFLDLPFLPKNLRRKQR